MKSFFRLLKDPTWVAHAVGLGTITLNEAIGGNPIASALISALTAVFHICQTFGNGVALPPGFTTPGSAAASTTAASGGASVVGLVPPASADLTNAAGTATLEP